MRVSQNMRINLTGGKKMKYTKHHIVKLQMESLFDHTRTTTLSGIDAAKILNARAKIEGNTISKTVAYWASQHKEQNQ